MPLTYIHEPNGIKTRHTAHELAITDGHGQEWRISLNAYGDLEISVRGRTAGIGVFPGGNDRLRLKVG